MLSGREISLLRAAADSLTEDEAQRQLYFAAGGLVLLGILLLFGTIWWWRSTRPESPALAPLEVMSSRRWTHASAAERVRMADEVRPHPGPAPEQPEQIPLDVARVEDPEGDRFDDLREFDELLGLGGTAPASADEVAAVPVVDGADDPDATDDAGNAAESAADEPAASESSDTSIADDDDVDEHENVDVDAHSDEAHLDDEDDGDAHDEDEDETNMIAIDPLLRLSRPD